MISGLIAVVVVLAVASAAGLALRRRQGKFKLLTGTTSPQSPAEADPRRTGPHRVLTAADLGAPLGKRATLVQFSTEFCSNCPQTRRMLSQVAAEHDGIDLVEVDAAARMDLTRRLNVLSTPTVLILGPDGTIASRASGLTRRSDVLAALRGIAVGSGGA